ncbi:thiamine pyrophosphate-dependent enzyme [Kutzneria sp. NPDC052558]|uniref:thiamine pyrophosphate-dependent enzyme n=1 Tax=Kutzneria sp. NPDC052558 TaxID=3364121 RepID=UPI0037C80957
MRTLPPADPDAVAARRREVAVAHALGVKLACPDRTTVSLVGDGAYLLGVPASAQWTARRYDLPPSPSSTTTAAGSRHRQSPPCWQPQPQAATQAHRAVPTLQTTTCSGTQLGRRQGRACSRVSVDGSTSRSRPLETASNASSPMWMKSEQRSRWRPHSRRSPAAMRAPADRHDTQRPR